MNPGGSDIVITVGGDISPLETALAAVPEAFAGITTQIDDAFAGLGTVTSDLQNLAAAAGEAVAPVQELGEQLGLFAEVPLTTLPEVNEQLSLFATYAGEAAATTETLASASSSAAASVGTLASSEEASAASLVTLVAQLGLAYAAFQIIKGAIESVVEAYGEEQKATLALGALLGDQSQAAAAIDSAKQLADNLGLAQESAFSAQQKLIALGESLQNIPRDLTAIADGAAAMNTSFDTAAQRFDMIVNSGTLMARSLTSIGLNVQDVAKAMDLAGVPASTLTEAFRQLDETQRAAVLSSAELAKNAGLAATAASGVIGTWNQVKNAIGDAEQEIGKAIDGFSGLATVAVGSIRLIAQAFVGLVATVKIAVDAIIAGFQALLIPITAVGQAVSDAFTGKIKEIPSDLQAANHAIEDALKSGWSNIQKDASDAGSSVAAVWGTSMQAVATSTQAGMTQTINAVQAAQGYAEKLATQFGAISQAFAAGKVTAAQYTDALNALNKAQMDANNGLQNAGTALLLVENGYRELGVAATNAYTDLKATVAAVDAGRASWGQYVDALNTLNTAQKAANDGLEELATAANLADAAYTNLAVDYVNALTELEAVNGEVAKGTSGFIQHEAAVNAAQAAYVKLGDGILNANLAFEQALDNQRDANVSFQNLTIQVDAAYAAWRQTGQGLQQYLDLVAKLPGANEAAANGLLNLATAAEMVGAQHKQLENDLANAQTVLNAVQAGVDNGTVSYGQYQKALEAVKTAQEALNGTTQAHTAATQSATAAQSYFTNSLHGATSAMNDAATVGSTFATSLQYINGQWMQLGGHAIDASSATNTFATSLQVVNGQLQNVGTAAATATSTGLNPFATELQVINGQFVSLSSSSGAASSAINNVANTAKTAAQAIASLGDELDKTMNAQISDLQISLQEGQTYQDRFSTPYWLGGLGSTLAPGENPIGTTTKIFGGAPLGGSGKYGDQTGTATASTAAAQAASTVSDAMVTAINEAMAANELEAAAQAQIGTDAYQALKASADAAVAAAGAAITAAQGVTNANNAQAVATQAAAASTTMLADTVTSAGSTIQAAATGVAAVTAAVAQFVTPILGPGQGVGGDANLSQLNTNVPTIGSGTAGGIGNGLKPPTSFATSLIVNLNAGTVVGNNGMQQLSTMAANEMVQQLSRLGIRLNRQ